MDGILHFLITSVFKVGAALLFGVVGVSGETVESESDVRRLATAGFDIDDVVAGNFPRPQDLARADQAADSRPRTGMVFLEDSYLPAPYVVTADDGQLSINGVFVKFGTSEPDPQKAEQKAVRSADHLTRLLNASSIVAITPEAELDVLSSPSQQAEFLERLLKLPLNHVETGLPSAWMERANSIAVTGTIQRLGKRRLELINHIYEKNLQASAATRRFHDAAYPLTILGMLVCAFSMGHLLQSAPRIQTEAQRRETSDQWIRAATISVALFVVMAMLDLTWTLLASNAGKMQELNPMGNSLLGKPIRLVAAKIGATITSAGILISLRTNPRAQKAAWWICLLCTLLTMRWLVFNSLFVD